MTTIPKYTRVRVNGEIGTVLEGPYRRAEDYYVRLDGTDRYAFVLPAEMEVINDRTERT